MSYTTAVGADSNSHAKESQQQSSKSPPEAPAAVLQKGEVNIPGTTSSGGVPLEQLEKDSPLEGSSNLPKSAPIAKSATVKPVNPSGHPDAMPIDSHAESTDLPSPSDNEDAGEDVDKLGSLPRINRADEEVARRQQQSKSELVKTVPHVSLAQLRNTPPLKGSGGAATKGTMSVKCMSTYDQPKLKEASGKAFGSSPSLTSKGVTETSPPEATASAIESVAASSRATSKKAEDTSPGSARGAEKKAGSVGRQNRKNGKDIFGLSLCCHLTKTSPAP